MSYTIYTPSNSIKMVQSPANMTNTHLFNSFQLCLRKLREVEEYQSFLYWYNRLSDVIAEMANRELSPSPIPQWVKDKDRQLDDCPHPDDDFWQAEWEGGRD